MTQTAEVIQKDSEGYPVNPVNHHVFTVPVNHGQLSEEGFGYDVHEAQLCVYSAPKAVYFDVISPALNVPVSIGLNVDRVTSLIVTLQQALEEHQRGKKWFDSLDMDAFFTGAVSEAAKQSGGDL